MKKLAAGLSIAVVVAGGAWALSRQAPKVTYGPDAVPDKIKGYAVDYFVGRTDWDGSHGGPDMLGEPTIYGEAATTLSHWKELEPHNFEAARVRLSDENRLEPVYATFARYKWLPAVGGTYLSPGPPELHGSARIVFDESGDLLSVNAWQSGKSRPSFGGDFDR
jgi:hypothetical protein